MTGPEEDLTQGGHLPYWPGAGILVFVVGGRGFLDEGPDKSHVTQYGAGRVGAFFETSAAIRPPELTKWMSSNLLAVC